MAGDKKPTLVMELYAQFTKDWNHACNDAPHNTSKGGEKIYICVTITEV